MRIIVIVALLLATAAHADRGPYFSRAAAGAALFSRTVVKEPDRLAKLTTLGMLRVDIESTKASCVAKVQQKGLVKATRHKAWFACFADVLAAHSLDPQWIVVTADKLASKEQQEFAKHFGKMIRFATNVHRGGVVMYALQPMGKNRLPIVVGVFVDEIAPGVDL
jgi:hypothetical protein